jgi:hypothetical protein
MLLAGYLVMALALAVPQSFVLRACIPAAWRWPLATVLGTLVGWFVANFLRGLIIVNFMWGPELPSAQAFSLLEHAMRALAGGIEGVAQWFVLRRFGPRALIWPLASAVGSVALLGSIAVLQVAPLMLQWTIGGAAYGAVTGAALSWPIRGQPERRAPTVISPHEGLLMSLAWLVCLSGPAVLTFVAPHFEAHLFGLGAWLLVLTFVVLILTFRPHLLGVGRALCTLFISVFLTILAIMIVRNPA